MKKESKPLEIEAEYKQYSPAQAATDMTFVIGGITYAIIDGKPVAFHEFKDVAGAYLYARAERALLSSIIARIDQWLAVAEPPQWETRTVNVAALDAKEFVKRFNEMTPDQIRQAMKNRKAKSRGKKAK